MQQLNVLKSARTRKARLLSAACAGVTAAALLSVSTRAFAADITWNGTTGDYNVAGNWSAGVPGGGDNAINNTNSSVLIQAGDPDWAAFDLRAGDAPGSTGTYEQTGSNVTANSWFRLATNNSQSTGYYNLSSGTLTVHGHFHVGEQGTGVFNQTGGAVVCDGTQGGTEVDLGRASGAVGTINISAGTFLVNGTNGGNENIVLGAANGGTGFINVSGTGTITNEHETWAGQGTGGTGTLTVSAGTYNARDWLVAGRSGGTGTFNFTGGVVNKTNGGVMDIGESFQAGDGTHSTGTMNVSGSAVINCDSETWIGQGGPTNGSTVGSVGVWNNSGGTYNAHNWIAISRNGATGTMNLSGGSIVKDGNGNITSSGIGAVNHTNGTLTNTSSETWLAEGGTSMNWNFSGGTENLGSVSVGRAGGAVAVMNVSGTAIFNAGTVGLGVFDSSSGTINLSGGTFTADRVRAGQTINAVEQVSTGSKAFNFTGGELVVNHFDLSSLLNTGNGTLSPGGDGLIGLTTINGGYTQASTASMNVDIASLSSYDTTTATANSLIDGVLSVSLVGGYVPAAGTVYNVFTTTGSLTDLPVLSGPAGSLFTEAIVNGNTLQLTATAVPEPASMSLLGFGAMALVARRRNRTAR